MSLKKASRTKSLSLSGDDFPLRPAKPRGVFVTAKRPEDTLKIMKYIDDNVIGKGVAFLGPFGRRKVVYADYSSSGRSLQFLEDYINKEVLPALGDASCISAVTGLQSHLYDNEARDLVRAAVGATAEDEIVFCDNPVERICFLLSNAYTQGLVCDTSNNNNRSLPPILFVSTSEPIANLKVWLDGGWHVERITKNHEGFLDLVELDRRLLHYSESRRLMVGLFSGASRVTGMLADDVATTILLHQYDALSIWDHSMAASSAPICANPILPGAQKDAIFFQCRRMVGGVQAPGVLVIKKKLVENSLSFTKDTVDVVGAVRAGLVLQLKESLGVQAIMGRMEKICKQMLAHVRTIPEIALLGPTCTTAKRLTSLCFMVRHPRGAFLHHRFVVAVLNDVFGIQATADNVVADLLGINPQLAVEYEKVLNDESLKAASIHPGYIRVTFPFFMTETEVGFILEALKMVATEAWKLLPQYEVDDRTGEWRHHSNSLAKERKWLGAIRYTDGKMLFSDRRISGPGSFPQNYADCLQTARNLFNRARKMAQRSASDEIILKLPHPSVENLRWYMLPGEAHELLLGHSHSVKNTVPFDPTKIPENPSLQMIHRHHSLSALDIKRFKSRSLPASPLQVSIRRQLSGSPQQSHSPTPTPTSSPPIVRFSLGGEVTNYSPPQVNHLIALENSPSRNSSCSESVEDIHAYVKEVTKELATEIKSEIREVISKVEDVLESTDSLDMSGAAFNSLGNISYSNDNKRDSISTSDVVDYLREFSKGMMNDVKSEIRDVVNAVDEIISPDGCLGSRKNSPPDILKANNASGAAGGFKFLTKQRFSDTVPVCRPLSTDINKHRSESFPRPNSSTSTTLTAPSPEHSAPGFPYTGAVAKSIDLKSSMSSQDSGINMCFSEQEERLRGGGATTDRNRTISARLEGDLRPAAEAPQRRVQSESTGGESTSHHHHELHVRLPATPEVELVPPKIGQLTRQQNVLKSSPSQEQQDPDSSPEGGAKWRNLPKEVWKQAAEALDDFDMIKDGDRIMVCLSGSSSSLSLLHLLRQFVRARNLSNVQLATVCFGDCGVDPRALMLYLRELGVEFFYERKESVENLQEKLAGFAYHKGYNVLAMANTLDKLADRFLVSLLNKGKLNAIQAVGPSAHLTDVRIIRPLLYIRERTLEDFASANEFPARPSRLFTRPLDAASSILRVQEANNPNVYGNIRSALKPLLALRLESTKSSYESLKASLTNRD
ncbi:uncharacterized protein LOC129763418 isoform X4 [Toxorhynchites rutilus septentrionalis]|uniref:uncharacterized protein LOC129763418 isoform X4 n=1 Tax=Toxorhynchites rutilus septentrionalis TaxID=329112 RepID=UPI0024792A13|nr:uncharacterized protein LOC129763418 isoform X4 [Toxorhynchites rutilus septentrionalis]